MKQEVKELREIVAGLTPEQMASAAGRTLAHRLIRMDYLAWCTYQRRKVGQTPALHHRFIIEKIQQLLDGETLPLRNLMIMTPPGSAKSTYTSLLLPPWYVNPLRCPRDLILSCSYSYSLVEGFGRQARDILEEESQVLGVSLSKTASASGDWRTNINGGYFCAGVNAGITGRRAGLGVIDDFLASEEEAQSQLIRDKNWSWYINDFVPRLLPNAFRLLIFNHRHEDDLGGRILNSPDANKWLVIKLPMLAEENDPIGRQPGDRLWPEWFTQEQVDEARRYPQTWSGLYQQRPTPEDGNFFKKEWLLTYRPNELPSELRYYIGADFAVRKSTQSDKFAFFVVGVDSHGHLWIVDWWWQKADTGEAVDKMFELTRLYKPVCWFVGREAITGSLKPFITRRMMDEQFYFHLEELSEAKDKVQKTQSFKARCSSQVVHFPDRSDWEKLRHQLLVFPNGSNDDAVDALGKIGMGLDKMVPAARKFQLEVPREIPDQPLTCRWVEKSHQRKERERRAILADN